METSNQSRLGKRPILLVLDFDGTLTIRDTMEVMASVGYAEQAESGHVVRPWSEIVAGYMRDWEEHSKNYPQSTSQRQSLTEEIAWLNSLENIERASFQGAVSAGIFDGVTVKRVQDVVRKSVQEGGVELRRGWAELIQLIQSHNRALPRCRQLKESVQIISVNWSSTFIREVLHESLLKANLPDEAQPSLSAVKIYANELPSLRGETAGDTTNSSPFQSGVHTSRDKVKILETLMLSYIHADKPKDTETLLTVYVGDSTTDLECLCHANFGICIRSNPMTSSQRDLNDTCRRVGRRVKDLSDAGATSTASEPALLFHAMDFSVVHNWLLQLQGSQEVGP